MDLVDNELTLTPIAGKSGKAYMGTYPDGALSLDHKSRRQHREV